MLPVFPSRRRRRGRQRRGQPMSWVGLDDAIGALHFLMINERAQGPINVVSPAGGLPIGNSRQVYWPRVVLRRPGLGARAELRDTCNVR